MMMNGKLPKRSGNHGSLLPFDGKVAAMLLLIVALVQASVLQAATATTVPLTPYKVLISLAVSWSPELTPTFERDLQAELPTRSQSLYGAAWRLSVSAMPAGLRWTAVSNIESITAESVLGTSPDADKVILLAIGPWSQGYRVVARQLDVRSQTWNAPVSREVRQTSRLSDAAMRAVAGAFGPTGTVEAINKEKVEVRLQASAIATLDPTVAVVRPGDVLRPVLRMNDAGGKAEQIARPTWTLLRVENVSPERIECRLECGLQDVSLPASSGRLESLAIGVSKADRATRLVMRCRTPPQAPLAGCEVCRTTDDGQGVVLVGRSNRQGEVTIPSRPGHAEVLLVCAGGQPLARLPLVPGADAEITASLPDATMLVEANGRLAGIQEQIFEEVAQRQCLIAAAKTHLDAKRIPEAEAVLAELKALPGPDAIAKVLAEDKKGVVVEDPAVQQRIDALFTQTTKLLNDQLNSEPIAALESACKSSRSK
jgi:hypothetical protein